MQKVQHGFTLIEVLIVIAIIGILASVAFPVYQTYLLKSEIAVGFAELSAGKSNYSVAVSEGETVTDITTVGISASTSVCTMSAITNNTGIQCAFLNSSIGTSATLELQYSAGVYSCVAQNVNNTNLLPPGCTQ